MYVSEILFEDILHCNSMQKVLVWLFLQFYGNAPSRRIQSPMVKYQNKLRRVRVKPKQGRVLRAYGAENENSCGGNKFYSSAVEDHWAIAT
jgi:hypothetical protein